jgi:hypothetical protein
MEQNRREIQVIEFTAHFYSSFIPVHDSIDRIHILEEYIRIYGRGIIKKITFHFHPLIDIYNSITVYNSEPNHKFNVDTDKIQLFRELYHIIMSYMSQSGNIYDILGKYIISPYTGE